MYKSIIFDLDGTIYLEDTPIDGSIDFLNSIKDKFDIFFVTNNSSVSRKNYFDRLYNMGVEELKIEQIITPIKSMVEYLLANNIKKVFAVATEVVKSEMKNIGLEVVETIDDIDAVITAFDKELTYNKLLLASQALLKGIPFYTAHIDITCPTKIGPIPDVGCINAFLEKATNISPITHFGKPSQNLVMPILKNYKKEDILIVGDRIYTDYQLAKNSKIDFALVLTGETKNIGKDKPKFVLNSVVDLGLILKN